MGAHSTIPAILALLTAAWVVVSLDSLRRSTITSAGLALLLVWMTTLAGWGLASAHFALNGAYDSNAFLALIPGFWLPLVPAVITVFFALATPFRDALLTVVATHPRSIVFIQAIRVTAIGGVIKGLLGLLPPSFALPVGIPDFLFGVVGVGLGVFWPRGGWSPRTLIIWNIFGIAAILPAAPVLMQMGLPGPLYTFTSAPDARALFDYPMVLAPTLLVPVFVTMNVAQVAVLLGYGRNRTIAYATDSTPGLPAIEG